jgi:hypothetical protein
MDMLGSSWFRLGLVGVAAGCLTSCSRRPVVYTGEAIWPDPAEIVRVELLPGVSVLAPAASFEQGDIPKPWGRVSCKTLEPMKGGGRAVLDCTWYGNKASRTLAFTWYPGVLRERLSPARQLDVLAQEFSLSGKGDDVELRPLRGRWVGWSWATRAAGNLIRNRYVVVGCDVAFLQAVSEVPDVFENAELFFDSLAVDWARSGAQLTRDCGEG